jgi:hypothetical protein
VRILKEGTFFHRTAIVVDSNWDGKVKVELDGVIKSYTLDELEATHQKGPPTPPASKGAKKDKESMVSQHQIQNRIGEVGALAGAPSGEFDRCFFR